MLSVGQPEYAQAVEENSMSFWKRLFGQRQTPLEELRERIDASDVDRVSCMDVVRTIRKQVAGFKKSK